MSVVASESFLRIAQVLEIVPVSRATWYAGVKSGRYPQQVKLGLRAAAWKRSDIEKLVATLAAQEARV